MHVQRASVAPAQSFTMQRQSADAPRCPSFNHTTAQAAPISHNLASASSVDAGGRALRKRQVDVGNSEVEGFKELFQVFSLTQRYVTPDGNCMPLSAAGRTLWQDMPGAEDFEGFFVTEKKAQQLDALEGERQRTVKEWYTFMGNQRSMETTFFYKH